jgi:hypothetical protein
MASNINPDTSACIDHALRLITTDPTLKPFISLLNNMKGFVKSTHSTDQTSLNDLKNKRGDYNKIKAFEQLLRLHDTRIAELEEALHTLTPAIIDGIEMDGGFRGHKFKYKFKVGHALVEWKEELAHGQWEWKEEYLKRRGELEDEGWKEEWIKKCEVEPVGSLGQKRGAWVCLRE